MTQVSRRVLADEACRLVKKAIDDGLYDVVDLHKNLTMPIRAVEALREGGYIPSNCNGRITNNQLMRVIQFLHPRVHGKEREYGANTR